MIMTGAPARRGGYHHGDLARALVAAAEELVAERGPEGFTLRECARRVGVSNAAPAHHFKDVRTLLSEVAALGFERLTTAMLTAREAARSGWQAQLKAIGLAYVATAIAHPATFRLMFHSDRCNREHPRLKHAGAAAYGVLTETLAGMGEEGCTLAHVHLAWSVVHGFATLQVEGRLQNDPRFGPPGRWPEHADAVLTNLVEGLAHRAARAGSASGTSGSGSSR